MFHFGCRIFKYHGGRNKHLFLFCSSNDMDSEKTFIDSDMMLYVIGRIQKKEMETHHQEYRDLGQLICWFARILLLTIEEKETFINSRVNIYETVVVPVQSACSVAKVSAHSDCGEWGMKTSYQRTSGKIVGHSFGGCGTSNTPDSALLYIFSTFIHHTSQRAIFIAKDPNLAISELGDTRISTTATVILKYSTSEGGCAI
ncbi:hypothetical protein V1477_021088 [Vespula maculifrons]|uniref:Uncharacterized protein n=1 Tax=Vespula maculifrons TaxID=7453 RepID=A0ABD2AH41_VESMC